MSFTRHRERGPETRTLDSPSVIVCLTLAIRVPHLPEDGVRR